MATERVGVELAADGAAAYLSTIEQIEDATQRMLSGFSSAVASVNRFDDTAGAAAKSAARLGDGSEMAAKGADTLSDDAQDAAKAAGTLGDEAGDAAKGVDKLGDAADKAGDDVDGLGKDSRKGAGGLDVLKEAAVGAARKLGEFAVEGAQQAAEAVLQFVGDSIGAAGDFEAGMNSFASVTGSALEESGQSLEQFKELFISLGRDLPVSTAEVQQAAIEMAKGGIAPATIAAGGLKTALDLAAAGGVGIAESAEIMAKQLGVWVDKSADAADKATFLASTADLLSQAANASTVNVDDLAIGLANVGGVAKVAGLSFQETVTAMALIAPGFSSASDAGTSLKTMLSRLQPQTESAAQAFKDLGLLTEEGTSKFYDAEGSFVGMEKASELLSESLEGMSEAQRSAALSAAFGSDAIRAAAFLADAGAEGYRQMAEDMLKAGTAAEQAARKQQGFNVAVENVKGSLEAFMLTIGGAVLPILTNLAGVLASGINSLTNYAKATLEGKTALSAIVGFISANAMPILAGLTGAIAAWALVQTVQAIPAVLASIPALIAQTTAFIANAAAVAAALAPYALIAIAIGGVVKAWTDFNAKISEATQNLLNSHPAWVATTEALARYDALVGPAKESTSSLGETVRILREQITGEIEDLARRDAAGLVSDAQRDAARQHINQLGESLTVATGALNGEIDAINAETAASMTATSQIQAMTGAHPGLDQAVSLTAEEMQKLNDQIHETWKEGGEALGAYASTSSDYLSGVEDRQAKHKEAIEKLNAEMQKATTEDQKKGIQERIDAENEGYRKQEETQALSYAEQQAAQRQHLGQMLIDYTVNQALLGNISKEKAAEITAGLETEYGLQESSTATTFLHMTQSIDRFASDSGASIQGLVGDLRGQETAAKDAEKAGDDYAKEYVAKVVGNFIEKEGEAKDLAKAIEDIPSYKDIEVHTNYTSSGGGGGGGTQQMALGGPVASGVPYLVGERGPELFVPDSPGRIIPAGETRRMETWGEEARRNTEEARKQIEALEADQKRELDDLQEQLKNTKDKKEKEAIREKIEQAKEYYKIQLEQFKKHYAAMQEEQKRAEYMEEQTRRTAILQAERDAAWAAAREEQAEKQRREAEQRAEEDQRNDLLFQKEQTEQAHQQKMDALRLAYGQTSHDVNAGLSAEQQRILQAMRDEQSSYAQALAALQALLASLEGRASGGMVASGSPYLVGERGPELFMPQTDGTIIPAAETRRALASPAQMAAEQRTQTINNYNGQVGNTFNMPVYTNQSPAVLVQSLQIAQALAQ